MILLAHHSMTENKVVTLGVPSRILAGDKPAISSDAFKPTSPYEDRNTSDLFSALFIGNHFWTSSQTDLRLTSTKLSDKVNVRDLSQLKQGPLLPPVCNDTHDLSIMWLIFVSKILRKSFHKVFNLF